LGGERECPIGRGGQQQRQRLGRALGIGRLHESRTCARRRENRQILQVVEEGDVVLARGLERRHVPHEPLRIGVVAELRSGSLRERPQA
jgi:hypothetical protein